MTNNANSAIAFWTQLEGSTIDGIYPMLKLITASNTAALYETKIPGDDTPYILIAIANASQERLQIWERVRMFNHPSILRILRSGLTDVDGVPVTYAIEEKPDEYLSSVFAERPLTGDEAKQVLTKVLDALDYIHTQALVHSCVQPHHIMAVDDAIKVSGECLQIPGSLTFEHDASGPYRAPEVPVQGYTAAADIWSLGATLFEALTRRGPTEVTESRVAALPSPFSDIVAGCLQTDPGLRWTERHIQLALRGERAAPARVAAAAAGAGATVGHASGLELDAEPQQYNSVGEPVGFSHQSPYAPADQTTAPIPADEPTYRSRSSFDADHHPKRISPLTLVMSVATASVIGIVWYGRVHNTHHVAPATTPSTAVSTTSTTPPPNVLRVLPAAPAHQTSTPAITHAPSSTGGPTNWRVVAFTYNRVQDAERKVEAQNRKGRGPKASVFAPTPGRGPYLVSIGGPMTREQALKLRAKVTSYGYPRGSYAQNFQR